MHVRARIVAAVVANLEPLIAAGVVTSIRAGRAAPEPVAASPYLLVYARQEQSGRVNMQDDPDMRRVVVLAIEGVYSSPEDSDAAGDGLALAVEKVLAENLLGGLIRDIELARTDLDARAAEGETRIGRVRLEYQVEYFTPAREPESSLS